MDRAYSEESLNEGQQAHLDVDMLCEAMQNVFTNGNEMIPPYSGTENEDILNWLEQFENVAAASSWREKKKISKLRLLLRGPAQQWFKLYVLDGGDDAPKGFDEITELMKTHFLPTNYETRLREKLNNRKQRPFEPVTCYIFDKQALCRRVNPDMSVRDTIDYIYEGFTPEIQQAICAHDPETVEELLHKAKLIERGIKAGRSSRPRFREFLREPPQRPYQNYAYRPVQSQNPRFEPQAQPQAEYPQNRKVVRFPQSTRPSPNFNRNRARTPPPRTRTNTGGPTCYNCQRVGHVRRYCPLNNPQNNERNLSALVGLRFDPNEDRRRGQLLSFPFKVNDYQVEGVIDTGSVITAVDEKVATKLALPIRSWSGPTIYTANGSALDSVGEIELIIQLDMMDAPPPVHLPCMVVKDAPFELLLGSNYNRIAKVSIDCDARKIMFADHVKKVSDPRRIHSKFPIEIPARSAMTIRVVAEKKKEAANNSALVKPDSMQSPLIFPDSLVHFLDGEADLHVINARYGSYRINAGSVIGNYDQIPDNNKEQTEKHESPLIAFSALNPQHEFCNKQKLFLSFIALFFTFSLLLMLQPSVVTFANKMFERQFFKNLQPINMLSFCLCLSSLAFILKKTVNAFCNPLNFIALTFLSNLLLHDSYVQGTFIALRSLTMHSFSLLFTSFILLLKAIKTSKITSIALKVKQNCMSKLQNCTNKHAHTCTMAKEGAIIEYGFKYPIRPLRVKLLRDENGWIRKVEEKEVDENEKESLALRCRTRQANSRTSPLSTPIMIKCEGDEYKAFSFGIQLTHEQSIQMQRLVQKYISIFATRPDKLGRTTVYEHQIDTGSNPPIHRPPYRVSLSQRAEIQNLVSKMLGDDVIRPSKSPWASPVVLVKKKDGTTRFCVDYRKLNSITTRDVYPLPNIQDALDALQGAKYFSLLDLVSGYWQVPVSEKDKEKTAFCTPDGLFEYQVMPFGLSNAPSAFQRMIDVVLAGLKWNSVLCYLDDVAVFSETFEDHLVRLENVFKRLKEANLTLKPEKCSFALPKMLYLGHVITAEGISMDPEKINSIKNFPTPRSLTDVRSFVGLASYYRRFIKNFSSIAEPLTRLTKKEEAFKWTGRQAAAFETLKDRLMNEPILAHFNPELETEVRADACGYGLGAALVQKHDDGFHVISYAARLMKDAEKNYPTTEQEVLAIVYAVEKFRHYLLGLKFVIVTDHCSLCYIMTKTKLSPRLTRWAMMLLELDFQIRYKSGKIHKDADCLSRYPSDPAIEQEERPGMFSFTLIEETTDVSELQRSDQTIAPLIRDYENFSNLRPGQKKKLAKYTMMDNKLYKQSNTPEGAKLVLMLPKALRRDVLYAFHDDPLGGHLGIQKTLDKIRERFYFPRMSDYIKAYVKSCQDCQTRKVPTITPAGLLQPIKVGGPFDRVGIDILGPFPRSKQGNNNIIVATDYLSRYAITRAVPDITAETVAQFFIDEIVCEHGAPRVILSDRGRQFIAKVSDTIFALMHTKHVTTTSYHPQTNGLTERFNKTLTTMLSMYVSAAHNDWDRSLKLVTFAYNTAKQSTTGFSPFYLMYARHPVTPCEVIFDTPTLGITNEDEYVQTLISDIERVRKIAKRNIERQQKVSKLAYDKKHEDRQFEVGDRVLVHALKREKGKSTKMKHPYHGPFIIQEKLGPLNYRVKTISGRKREDTVHVNRLKHFVPRDSDEDFDFIPQPNQVDINNHEQPEIVANDNEQPAIVHDEGEQEQIDSTPQQPAQQIITTEQAITAAEALQEPLPRRSPRTRNKPNRLTYFLALLALIASMETSDAFFNRVTPLLWRKTKTPIVSGEQTIAVRVKFEDPCFVFRRPDIQPPEAREYFERLCMKMYQDHFLKRISPICPTSDSQPDNALVRRRQKRLVVMTGIAVGAAIVGLISAFSTIGLSTVSIAKSVRLERKTELIENELSNLSKKAKMLAKNDQVIKKALTQMQNNFDALALRVDQNTERLDNLTKTFPRTSALISKITSRFLIISAQLKAIERSWTANKFNPLLMELFNFTLPCGRRCPIELVQPKWCTMDARKDELTFRLEARKINESLTLMRADPFVLYERKKQSNHTYICTTEYAGPEHVVYDRRTRCSAPIKLNKFFERTNVLPGGYACNPSKQNIYELWTHRGCIINEHFTENEIAQVKYTEEMNFIYCSSFNITVFGKELACPDFVFSLPPDVSFKIGRLSYNVDRTEVHGALNFDPLYSYRINFQMFPKMHEFQLRQSFNETRRLIKAIDNQYPEADSVDPTTAPFFAHTLIFVSSLLAIPITLALVYCGHKCLKGKSERYAIRLLRKRNKNFPEQNKQVFETELKELVEEEEAKVKPSKPTRKTRLV